MVVKDGSAGRSQLVQLSKHWLKLGRLIGVYRCKSQKDKKETGKSLIWS